jgi:hypothetical protein
MTILPCIREEKINPLDVLLTSDGLAPRGRNDALGRYITHREMNQDRAPN